MKRACSILLIPPHTPQKLAVSFQNQKGFWALSKNADVNRSGLVFKENYNLDARIGSGNKYL